MTTGEKIVALRKENNISQEALANKLSVSRQAVSKWENDTSIPTTENLLLLSQIFGTDIEYFLSDRQSEKSDENQVDILNAKLKKALKIIKILLCIIAVLIAVIFTMNFKAFKKTDDGNDDLSFQVTEAQWEKAFSKERFDNITTQFFDIHDGKAVQQFVIKVDGDRFALYADVENLNELEGVSYTIFDRAKGKLGYISLEQDTPLHSFVEDDPSGMRYDIEKYYHTYNMLMSYADLYSDFYYDIEKGCYFNKNITGIMMYFEDGYLTKCVMEFPNGDIATNTFSDYGTTVLIIPENIRLWAEGWTK